MRLVKKLISAVCALGMIATLSSAFVVQAATTPTVKVELTQYDEETKIGTLAVKILDLDKTVDERPEDLFVCGIQFGLKLPADTFDSSYYSTGKGGQLSTNVKMGSRFSSDVTGPAYNSETIAATFLTNSTDPGKALNSYNGDNISEIEFMTINFKKLTDDPVDLTDLVGNVMLITRHYDAAWSSWETESKYGNMLGCDVANYDFAEIDPVTIEGPTIQSVGTFSSTDEEATTLPNQRAVASIATIAADEAATGITWSIDVTGGDNAGSYNKTFDLATLETNAEMKFGLIVEYDTTQADSVAITGAELVK